MHIAIHGVPRSGTTWLGEIFNSSPLTVYKFQPLFSYAFKGFLTESSSPETILEFFEKLSVCSDDFLDQAVQRKNGTLPSPRKENPTHVVYKEVRYHNILDRLVKCSPDDFRLLLIVRNPLAVINSWLRAPKEFRPDLGWSELDEWRFAPQKNLERPEEFNGFEKWKEATQIFVDLENEYPAKVKILTYEELVVRTEGVVENLFHFCQLPLSEQTLGFLVDSRKRHSDDAYSVFRSSACDAKWKSQLDSRIVDAIRADLSGTHLEKFLR